MCVFEDVAAYTLIRGDHKPLRCHWAWYIMVTNNVAASEVVVCFFQMTQSEQGIIKLDANMITTLFILHFKTHELHLSIAFSVNWICCLVYIHFWKYWEFNQSLLQVAFLSNQQVHTTQLSIIESRWKQTNPFIWRTGARETVWTFCLVMGTDISSNNTTSVAIWP